MTFVKSILIVGIELSLAAFSTYVGFGNLANNNLENAEVHKCRCARGKPNSYGADISGIEPAKPQYTTHTAIKTVSLGLLEDDQTSDQESSTSQNQMEFFADQCNQFCDCLPNTSMPNGWTGRQSSIGFWEHCWPCTLLQWPLYDLPDDITITEAKISLYCDSRWGPVTGQLYFAPVIEQWDRTVTYNRRPEIDTSMAEEISWPNIRQWFEIDVTTIAEKWADGTTSNFGIQLYALNSTRTGGIDIRTPGWNNPQYHPKLTITYDVTLDINEAINYFGQELSDMIPEIFAPNIVSLPDRDEAHCIFSPDGSEFLLSVTPTGNWANADILYFQQVNGQWMEPEIAPFSNTGTCNIFPTYTCDGQKVYFTSNRDFPGQFDADIWVTERTEQGWTEPNRLPVPVSSLACEWSPSVTNDGVIYFSSYRDGGVGRSGYNPDIWRTIPTDEEYIKVENIGAPVNAGNYDIWNVYVAPDGSFIIYMEERPGAGADLYISFREKDDSWTIPENLGPQINTTNNELGPSVSPDGKYLFFSRSEPGRTGDIYWVDIRAVPGFEEESNDTIDEMGNNL